MCLGENNEDTNSCFLTNVWLNNPLLWLFTWAYFLLLCSWSVAVGCRNTSSQNGRNERRPSQTPLVPWNFILFKPDRSETNDVVWPLINVPILLFGKAGENKAQALPQMLHWWLIITQVIKGSAVLMLLSTVLPLTGADLWGCQALSSVF